MMHRREFRAMGSRMLAVVDSRDSQPPDNLEQVPVWFEEWEQCLSRFRSDSELCRMNQQSGQPVQVSDTLWDVFQEAQQAEWMTGGLVTPLVLDALLHAGYDRDFEEIFKAGPRPLPEIVTSGYLMDEIRTDALSHTVRLPIGAHLDFGGVAKGWAASKAMKRLAAEGPALVDAGGDIAVSGPLLDGGGWQIGIVNPFSPVDDLETLTLMEGGVATSGKDYRRWMRGEAAQHHIIDPRTGLPAETDILTATVVAPSLLQAEAYAKAVLISGSQTGAALIEDHPELAGLLVLETGQVIYSRKMKDYLKTQPPTPSL